MKAGRDDGSCKPYTLYMCFDKLFTPSVHDDDTAALNDRRPKVTTAFRYSLHVYSGRPI